MSTTRLRFMLYLTKTEEGRRALAELLRTALRELRAK
jgi:hypothetical protein